MTKAHYLFAVLALAGCAPLTAESRLFYPHDQVGFPPLRQGFWITAGEGCPEETVRAGALPERCAGGELEQLTDGTWTFAIREPTENDGKSRLTVLNLTIVPATERPAPTEYAPVYLAEYDWLDQTTGPTVRYAAIVPIGVLPASEAFVTQQIDCADVLRDGPVEGIREERDQIGRVVRCVADNKKSVREAVRRAVIAGLHGLEQSRMVLTPAPKSTQEQKVTASAAGAARARSEQPH